MGFVRVIAALLFVLIVLVSSHDVPRLKPHLHVVSDPLNIDEELSARATRSTSSPKILTPSELISEYGMTFSATAGKGQTIAIVDAFGASTVESDLAVFSTQFGLPACTTANGCFKKVDQTGGTNYPVDDSGWGNEVALDVQTVHSVAPGAKILLVVANSASSTDLFTAVEYARLHANYVSMSFGVAESSQVSVLDQTYFAGFPNVAFFASAGDNGAGVQYPASSPHVVSVGGTSVYTTSSEAFSSERGWSKGGGGCSTVFTSPAVQSANSGYASLGCNGKRAVPDVAMDADPNSGVYVYYSYGCTSPPNCYYQVGGTSLAAPFFAARSAIRGAVVNVTYVYSGHITFRDITTGNNGFACKTGLDLVTGLGSWTGSS